MNYRVCKAESGKKQVPIPTELQVFHFKQKQNKTIKTMTNKPMRKSHRSFGSRIHFREVPSDEIGYYGITRHPLYEENEDFIDDFQSNFRSRWHHLSTEVRERYKQRFLSYKQDLESEIFGFEREHDESDDDDEENDDKNDKNHHVKNEKELKHTVPSNKKQKIGLVVHGDDNDNGHYTCCESLKLLDHDSLTNVLTFVAVPQILEMRTVSRSWNEIIRTCDFLWSELLQRDFYGCLPEPYSVESLIPSLIDETTINNEEKNDENDTSSSSSRGGNTQNVVPDLQRYQLLYGVMPTLERSESNVPWLRRNNERHHFILKTQVAPTVQLHKLVLILSLLHVNRYDPSILYDMVKVGTANDHKLMQLSQFCFAVLCGRERELYDDRVAITESDLDENNSDIRELSHGQEGERAGRCKLSNVAAISPNIEEDFMPFMYYNYMRPVVIDDNTCEWHTDENGWCPLFMNASFTWFYFAQFTTQYNPTTNTFVVSRAREQTGIA